jgi:hypothetical protein
LNSTYIARQVFTCVAPADLSGIRNWPPVQSSRIHPFDSLRIRLRSFLKLLLSQSVERQRRKRMGLILNSLWKNHLENLNKSTHSSMDIFVAAINKTGIAAEFETLYLESLKRSFLQLFTNQNLRQQRNA